MRCKTKKCTRAPQTGYEGYCKLCFRTKYPQRHAEKQERRRKRCACCGETKELHSSGSVKNGSKNGSSFYMIWGPFWGFKIV